MHTVRDLGPPPVRCTGPTIIAAAVASRPHSRARLVGTGETGTAPNSSPQAMRESSRNDSNSRRKRVLIALAIGITAGVTCYAFLARPGFNSDFFHVWVGVRALARGANPYTTTDVPAVTTGHYLQFYPLPALVLLLPLAVFPLAVAGGLFFGVSSAALTYVLSREGYHRLPIFLSAPFLMATSLGQWSPLIVAAALEPTLGFVFAAKPNIGLAAWIYRPTRVAIVGSLILVGISFAFLPTWPADWIRNIAGRPEKVAPIRTIAAPLLLLAILRWRKPEGRLFLAMTCIPQALFFYDQLVLWLLPRTFRQSLLLSLGSFLLWLTWFHRLGPDEFYVQKAIPYAIALYVIALPLVLLPLRRPPEPDTASPDLQDPKQSEIA